MAKHCPTCGPNEDLYHTNACFVKRAEALADRGFPYDLDHETAVEVVGQELEPTSLGRRMSAVLSRWSAYESARARRTRRGAA